MVIVCVLCISSDSVILRLVSVIYYVMVEKAETFRHPHGIRIYTATDRQNELTKTARKHAYAMNIRKRTNAVRERHGKPFPLAIIIPPARLFRLPLAPPSALGAGDYSRSADGESPQEGVGRKTKRCSLVFRA